MRFSVPVVILSISLLLAAAAVAADPSAQVLRGQWLRADGVARVDIAPCGRDWCMTNVWIKPGVTDEKVGEYIRLDVKPAGPSHWKGIGYDPQRHLEFSTEMEVAGDSMTTGGCLLGGLICKSTPWTRVP